MRAPLIATTPLIVSCPFRTDDMRKRESWRFPARVGALKDRYGAAEDHLAAQIARIVKTQRYAVHIVSA